MMDAGRRFTILVALALPTLGLAQGQYGQPPTDAAFAEQIRHLDPKNDKATRLEALRWINANRARKNAALAVPALERCIREDPDGEVRGQAVLDLCLIVKRLAQPCPLVVLEALLDREDMVRYQAEACMPFFKTYTPGSVAVLLRGMRAENAEVRSSILLILARAAGADRKALDAMEQAKQDKVFDVRHSAHRALFIAHDKLEGHLPYLIRLREDPALMLSPGPEDAELGRQERARRNLILLGITLDVIEWSDTRADELAAVLMKLLKDESALMRRGAANLIGAAAVKVELPSQRDVNPLTSPRWPDESWVQSILPYVEPEAAAKMKSDSKRKEAPQKSKVALRLEKLGVEAVLRKLRDDDPDRSVRGAARLALEQLARLQEKRP
jgi:hypothetical protein